MRIDAARHSKKARSMIGRADRIEIHLAFRPPYDWQTIIRFYMSHPIPGSNESREIPLSEFFAPGKQSDFSRVQAMVNPQLKLRIVTADPKIVFEVVRRVRKIFDSRLDPLLIANCALRFRFSQKLCERFPGLRLRGDGSL